MANLYEINQAILDCVDAETGEIISPEKLDELTMEFNQKVDGIARWIKNLEALSFLLKMEEARLDVRSCKAEQQAEALKRYLKDVLGGKSYSSVAADITFRKSSSVDVADESKVPEEYIRLKIKKEPDKTKIAKALKSGKKIPGCTLVENQSIQIK